MTLCQICTRKEVFVESKCKSCFLKNVEDRIRKEIRIGPEVLIFDDSSAGANLLIDYFGKTRKVRRVTQPGNNVLMPQNATELSSEFLDKVFFKKSSEEIGQTLLFPLRHVLEDECIAYCRLKGISFEAKEKTDSKEFIKSLGSRFSFSLVRSKDKLDEAKK